MRVLWFEVSTPSRYSGSDFVLAGWQDSLERIARTCSDIELAVAFESADQNAVVKNIDGVTYYPLCMHYSSSELHRAKKTWSVNAEKLIPEMLKVIKTFNPDLIHIFGTEWPFGLIAEHISIPVVIHIQGAIVPYRNAAYPPGFSSLDDTFKSFRPKRIKDALRAQSKMKTWEEQECRIWKAVSHYMGRTAWDKQLSFMMNPQRSYYHVEEALRPDFLAETAVWNRKEEGKCRLVTTGCSTFWKGPDMMLKTAKVLTDFGFDFEWFVAGNIPADLQALVEKKTNTTFAANGIRFLGFTQPSDLKSLLCESSMYVHTAYIENSPNSICEAQCLGVPVVSTNVGGISTLVTDGEDGLLVPANDPWQMAYNIIKLYRDLPLSEKFSASARQKALKRHADENIRKQLLDAYTKIIK